MRVCSVFVTLCSASVTLQIPPSVRVCVFSVTVRARVGARGAGGERGGSGDEREREGDCVCVCVCVCVRA